MNMTWRTWRGRIAYLLLALALAAAIGYGFMPRPAAVELAAARPGTLTVAVEEEGKTRVRERYSVSAPVAGFARRITLKVGDPVAAGREVAIIEPARAADLDPRSRAQAGARAAAARAARQAAEESARAAAAEEKLAEQELARAEALSQASFVSAAAVDQAKSRLQAARAGRQAADYQIQVARHEVAAAEAALLQAAALPAGQTQPVRVQAPVAGRVLAVPHESEGAVQPGQSLIEIGNLEALEVVVEVLSTAAVRIAPGTPVRFDRWGGEGSLEGRVRVVEPAGFTKISALGVEEQRVRVIADFTSPAERWRPLGDAYRVEAAFVLWEGRDVLLIPTSALFRHGDGWAAFVAEAGRARLRALRIGQRNGLDAQVLEGLKAGEQVILHPDDKIADGKRIRAR
jgi:HlyD family secretion protein